jgi:hypothetical protein
MNTSFHEGDASLTARTSVAPREGAGGHSEGGVGICKNSDCLVARFGMRPERTLFLYLHASLHIAGREAMNNLSEFDAN